MKLVNANIGALNTESIPTKRKELLNHQCCIYNKA